MDVARYGDYATLAYTNAKVQENYRRRFRITFPNEELPAARPLLTTPIRDRLTAANAVWGATFGLEHALWFQQPGLPPVEEVTFRRSNAWDQVAAEVAAVRERVGMTEISNYAKYRVTGPGAEAWLSSMLTARMPAPGRITLTAMLNEAGRIVGEFTVARATAADEFHLFGSLPAEVHHSRWFRHHLPPDGSVRFEVLGLGLTGLSVTGPRSRDVLGDDRAGSRPLDRGVPVHDLPAGRPGRDPGAAGPDQLLGRPGLRAVDHARIPARAVRPDRGRRRAPRPAAVRDAGAHVAPAREELWDVVPRVPADLHAARGRDHPLHQARPRVHRAGRPRGRAGLGWAGASARRVRRRAGPGRPGRRHRRRADLARRRRRRLGDLGRVRPPRQAVDRARLRADRACVAGRPRRRRVRDRDHRPATARPAPARAVCSTRRAPGCAQ